MGKVSVKDRRFLLDNKDFFIYSGEVHYFRIDPEDWADRLKKAKELGFNTIASYTPWGWHEYEEGKFDFTGKTHPRRNLLRFLKEVEKAGLYFIARIGPVSNGEMCGEGVPMWLFDNYPDLRAKNADGTFFHHGKLVSFHHPKYLEYVDKWYHQIGPIVEKRQYTHGGNIILVQLCNEIAMINWIARQPDYDPSATKNYREYLKKAYANVGELNQTYKTSFSSFEDIDQPTPQEPNVSFQRYLDWHQAYRHHYATYYQKLAAMAHKQKINVPIQANIPHFYDYDTRGRGHYSPMTTTLFKEYTAYNGPVIFGGAYQIRRLDYDNCQDIPFTTEMVRMISHKDVPLVCAELQSGIMRDYPRLYPQDVRLNLKTSTASGLNGLNCYMLCGGDNPPGVGHFGPYHEWQAPIDSKGRMKPHAEPLHEFGKWVETFGHMVSQTEKVSDFTFGFYPPYYETDFLPGELNDRLLNMRNRLFYDGLVRLSHLANYSYDAADLQKSSLQDLLKKPILCVFSLDIMDEDTQLKLAQYVKKGGKLILNPALPVKNLSMQPCSALLNELGVEIDSVTWDRFAKIGKYEATLHSEMYTFKKGNYQVFAKSLNGKPCGIIKKVGKGQVLILGGGLTHEFDYHIDIVRKMFEAFGLKPSIRLSNPDLLATLRKGKNGALLFIFNYHDVDHSTRVEMDGLGPKTVKFPVGPELRVPRRTARILPVQVPLDSKRLLHYTLGEILSIQRSGKSMGFELAGSGPFEWKMRTPKPKEVRFNHEPIAFSYEDGILNIKSEFTSHKNAILELIY